MRKSAQAARDDVPLSEMAKNAQELARAIAHFPPVKVDPTIFTD
jgi:ribulose 1,5-bisphosphate carboxylase large subunit-like protein